MTHSDHITTVPCIYRQDTFLCKTRKNYGVRLYKEYALGIFTVQEHLHDTGSTTTTLEKTM